MEKYGKLIDEIASTKLSAAKKFDVSRAFSNIRKNMRNKTFFIVTCSILLLILSVLAGFSGSLVYESAESIIAGHDAKCGHYQLCNYEISYDIPDKTCLITYINDNNLQNTCYFPITNEFTSADCAELSDSCIKSYYHSCPISECDYEFTREIVSIVASIPPLLIGFFCCIFLIGMCCREIFLLEPDECRIDLNTSE